MTATRPPFRLWSRLVLAFLLACAGAVSAHAEPLHPALWKVTRGQTTIWLFGTIHMLQPGADWCNGPVAAAADSADEIVTEVLDPAGEETQAAVLRRSLLPRGQHLAALLPPDEQTALAALLQREGLPANALDRYKPWYAGVVISALPLIRRGFAASNGVEAQLAAREAPRAPRRGALETADEQLGMLDGLPRRTQIAYLASVIADFASIDDDVDAMARAWGKGDADDLARLMNKDEEKDDPLLSERLILARNRHWADWIVARLDHPGPAPTQVFIAVGAGHLAGPGSVQETLVRRGVVVTRVQ